MHTAQDVAKTPIGSCAAQNVAMRKSGPLICNLASASAAGVRWRWSRTTDARGARRTPGNDGKPLCALGKSKDLLFGMLSPAATQIKPKAGGSAESPELTFLRRIGHCCSSAHGDLTQTSPTPLHGNSRLLTASVAHLSGRAAPMDGHMPIAWAATQQHSCTSVSCSRRTSRNPGLPAGCGSHAGRLARPLA